MSNQFIGEQQTCVAREYAEELEMNAAIRQRSQNNINQAGQQNRQQHQE
jgi:hypothetical protein